MKKFIFLCVCVFGMLSKWNSRQWVDNMMGKNVFSLICYLLFSSGGIVKSTTKKLETKLTKVSSTHFTQKRGFPHIATRIHWHMSECYFFSFLINFKERKNEWSIYSMKVNSNGRERKKANDDKKNGRGRDDNLCRWKLAFLRRRQIAFTLH